MECDFLVVGAGIAGASVAYELAEHGTVLLAERESQPGYHSTGRSAATFSECTRDRVIYALSAASKSFFERPPAGFSEVPLVKPRGLIMIARVDQRDSLVDLLGSAAAQGGALRACARDEVLQRVPVVDPGYLAGAAIEPEAMDLDVDAILQGYLRGARARGAQLLTDTELLALRRDGQRWTATTRNAEIRARVVVNAGGAWADHIAGLAGVQPIGLQPRRRSAFLFAVRGYVVDHWPMVKDVDEAFYFKPDAGRLLGSPADQTPVQPHDARADELALAHGVDRIERATTLSVGSLLHKWAGLRSFVADERPVVGYAPDVEGFFWVAGQGGVGIETAPALSRVAAAIAVHGEVPAGIAQYGVTGADLAATRRSLLAAR